jgi:hypothetical protein
LEVTSDWSGKPSEARQAGFIRKGIDLRPVRSDVTRLHGKQGIEVPHSSNVEVQAMAQKTLALCFGSGFAGIVLAILLFGGGSVRDRAEAQPAPEARVPQIGRYQISSFSYRWSDGSTCGAYILDTQTGEVFQTVGKNAPEPIGSVVRPQPK